MERITRSESETKQFAKEFAKTVKGGDLIFLIGDLGAGKTTFTKYLVKALHIKGEVLSPTFVLERIYSNKKICINHYDLYRIEKEQDIYDLGIAENIESGHVCIVEWPLVAKDALPKPRTIIKIEKLSENERKFSIEVEK